MSLRSDCLIAVTGAFPKKVTADDLAKANELTVKWDKRIKSFVTGEREEWEYREPPKDLDTIFRMCAADIAGAELAALQHPFAGDAELTAGFAMSLASARKFLVSNWPACTIQTEAGSKQTPPAIGEDDQIAAMYYMLDDPEKTLFAELTQCSIEQEQVAAFKAVMPELHAWALQSMQAAQTAMVAKDREWEPDHEVSAAMRIFAGLPPEIPLIPPQQQLNPPTSKTMARETATAEQLATEPIGRENAAGS